VEIVVSGGWDFIESALAERLVGHSMTVLDNLGARYLDNLRGSNLQFFNQSSDHLPSSKTIRRGGRRMGTSKNVFSLILSGRPDRYYEWVGGRCLE
jgi:nucleoside-diphosphate-sugar epimerase